MSQRTTQQFDGWALAGMGALRGVERIFQQGYNTDIDTGSVPETVWSRGGVWTAPTQARVHNLASTDAADTDTSGTGAHKVRVAGLDANWDEVEEVVNLNGLSNVATTNSYVMINKLEVTESGTDDANAGVISATAVTDATVTAEIPAGVGESLMAIYGVPRNNSLVINHYFINVGRDASGNTSGSAIVSSRILLNANQSTATWRSSFRTYAEGSFDQEFQIPGVIAGPALILVEVNGVTANNIEVSGGFSGLEMTSARLQEFNSTID